MHIYIQFMTEWDCNICSGNRPEKSQEEAAALFSYRNIQWNLNIASSAAWTL